MALLSRALSDIAIFFGSFSVNTPFFKSRALELSVTFCDQRVGDFFEAISFHSGNRTETRQPGDMLLARESASKWPTRLEHPRDV